MGHTIAFVHILAYQGRYPKFGSVSGLNLPSLYKSEFAWSCAQSPETCDIGLVFRGQRVVEIIWREVTLNKRILAHGTSVLEELPGRVGRIYAYAARFSSQSLGRGIF